MNRGCKRALKVPCSGKGDTSLTATSFTFTMASGFCRIIAALNIRSGPLEVWGIVVQSLSCVLFFVIPWTAAHQASLSGCYELNVCVPHPSSYVEVLTALLPTPPHPAPEVMVLGGAFGSHLSQDGSSLMNRIGALRKEALESPLGTSTM